MANRLRPRLGINIDHIATLRQARGEEYPSLVRGAELCIDGGADQITIHLREDRRHIQDGDVFDLRQITRERRCLLNLEMGASRDVLKTAVEAVPDWICLVPEHRQEQTTEGGLNLIERGEEIKDLCREIKDRIPGVNISLFVEADPKILKKAVSLPIDGVEIHTGEYARSFLKGEDVSYYEPLFRESRKIILNARLGHHAGHGLTRESLTPLLNYGCFDEYNIGHWVISESLFTGLGEVVASLKNQLAGGPCPS